MFHDSHDNVELIRIDTKSNLNRAPTLINSGNSWSHRHSLAYRVGSKCTDILFISMAWNRPANFSHTLGSSRAAFWPRLDHRRRRLNHQERQGGKISLIWTAYRLQEQAINSDRPRKTLSSVVVREQVTRYLEHHELQHAENWAPRICWKIKFKPNSAYWQSLRYWALQGWVGSLWTWKKHLYRSCGSIERYNWSRLMLIELLCF